MKIRGAALGLLFSVLACSGDGPSGPRARALLGGAFGDTPWPSDVFLVDGKLKVSALPFTGSKQNLDGLAAALGELDGFSIVPSIFFPTDGVGLTDGPLEGSARVVDLSAGSAAGTAHSFKLFYRARTKQIVAMPPRGTALRPGHRYGCFLDARRVAPAEAMRAALRGEGKWAQLYAPLVAELDGSGTDLEEVGAATVFTVGRPTRRLVDLHRTLSGTLPRARVDSVTDRSGLDKLLGVPQTTRSGLGDPLGVVHDSIEYVILGSFDAPYYLATVPSRRGRIQYYGAGLPMVLSTSQVPFALILPRPRRGAYKGVPVIIFQHGLNASRAQVLAVANDFARAGYATIGIDALWHGKRLPGAVDQVYNMTAAAGADGFADDEPISSMTVFFNITGSPADGILPFDARSVRDNFHQAVLDICQLVRLVRQGDLSELRAARPALATLSFAAQDPVYVGESFGSILGAQVVAVEPGVRAGVLAVGGGGIFLPIFTYSAQFQPLVGAILRASFDATIDLTRPTELPPEAQQSLSLLQTAIEPGDPQAYVSEIARLALGKPKSLLMLHAYGDEALPNESGDVLASLAGATAALIPGRTRKLRFVDVPTAALPITGNLRGATVVVASFDPATHIMFTRFTDVRKMKAGVSPPVALPQPQTIDNPIELLHGLTTEFVRSFRETGVPTVRLAR